MAFEIPKETDKIEIGGKIYGHPHMVMKFPPDKDLKKVQRALQGWNNDAAHKRAGLIFSIVMLPDKKFFGDRYTLFSWRIVDYTKEYIKSHPWIEYESYHDWQQAVENTRRGKKKKE